MCEFQISLAQVMCARGVEWSPFLRKRTVVSAEGGEITCERQEHDTEKDTLHTWSEDLTDIHMHLGEEPR